MKVKKAFAFSMLALAAGLIPGDAFAVFGTQTVDGGSIAIPTARRVSLQTEADGFGGGTRAAGLYLANDATNLYIAIPGNLSGNAYHIFLDTKAGGAADVATNVSYGEYDDLAVAGGGNMPAGFLVDYYINFKGSTDTGLIDVQAGSGSYKGNSGSPASGYAFSYNGANTEANPANYASVTTGSELQIPLADLGLTPGTTFKIFVVGGNENKGSNPATYMSNQILPPVAGATNYGNDGAGGAAGNGLSFNGTGGPNVTPLTYTVEAPATAYSATGYGRSTIGTGGTYATLKDATVAANAGLTRDASTWIFEFIGDTTEPTNSALSVNVDAAGSILFRPAYGLSPTVTFTRNVDDNLGASGNFLIGGNADTSWPAASIGVKNVTVNGNNGIADRALTFTNSGVTATFQTPISIVADADNVQLRNLRLINNSTGGTSNSAVAVRPRFSTPNTLIPDNWVIDNCELTCTASSQGHGVNVFNSLTLAVGQAPSGWSITNNDINARIRGVFFNPIGSGTVSNNRIAIGLGGTTSGISTYGVFHLAGNSVASTINILNNVIDVTTDANTGTQGPHGVALLSNGTGTTVNVNNNTIRLRNTATVTLPVVARGIQATSGVTYTARHNTIDIAYSNAPAAGTVQEGFVYGIGQFLANANITVQNNIISNRVPGGVAYYRSATPTGTFAINDNLLHVPSGNIASNVRLITPAGTGANGRLSTGTTRELRFGTTAHGLSVGNQFYVAFNANTGNSLQYQGLYTVATVPNTTSITYTAATSLTETLSTSAGFLVLTPNSAPLTATTLGEWQGSTSTPDVNSTVADVTSIISLADLHIVDGAAAGTIAAAQVGGITTDIDGQTRAIAPYRGADEFTTNTLPTAVNGTAVASVAENAASAVLVSAASGVDADINDFPAITATSSAGTVAVTRTSTKEYRVNLASALNFEANTSVDVTLTATDRAGQTTQRVFTIPVTNVNEAPTDIVTAPVAPALNESDSTGTLVATLSTVDPDAAETHVYTLVSGTGSTNNALFTIVGNELRTAAALVGQTGPLSVRVQTQDQNGTGLTYAEAISISLRDDFATVVSATSGQTISVTTTSGTLTGLTAAVSPGSEPVGVVLPQGVVSFSVTGLAVGGSTTITIAYPNTVGVNRAYKVNGTTYTEIPGATISATSISYSITDGGALDQDSTANGTIVDPAGPAVFTTSVGDWTILND